MSQSGGVVCSPGCILCTGFGPLGRLGFFFFFQLPSTIRRVVRLYCLSDSGDDDDSVDKSRF